MSEAAQRTSQGTPWFDVVGLRGDFPILHQEVRGKPLVYLDNAASTQKPRRVISMLQHYYETDNANVHRGVHSLSARATFAYERARGKVHNFLGAAENREIIFTRGTTEAINLVAQSYGRANLGEGDEVLVSEMEHHSNIVPWQQICASSGARLRVIPIDDRGELVLDEYARLLGPHTKIVAVTHVSNALGTVNPIAQICAMAHEHGAVVLVDGAQAVPHLRVDVQALGCDFYAFSAHKMYGPTGIGVLYGRAELLEAMPPWQGGGEMILSVSFEKTTYNELPYKFEAGTPHIAGAIGLGEAIDYLGTLSPDAVVAHERDVFAYAEQALLSIAGLTMIGTAEHKLGAHSFTLAGIHPHDIGTILDHEGVAVRTGHHCAQPVMTHFGVPATARASFGIYNTREDVDRLIEGLAVVQKMMG